MESGYRPPFILQIDPKTRSFLCRLFQEEHKLHAGGHPDGIGIPPTIHFTDRPEDPKFSLQTFSGRT
jgi:hypothetical protein